MAGHPFDLPLALDEGLDASETHADFWMLLKLEQAGADSAVAAAPTARLRPFDVVVLDCGLRHHVTSVDAVRPTRMLLPQGSVRVNSCMPHGMSSIGVTCSPAATNRTCQSHFTARA